MKSTELLVALLAPAFAAVGLLWALGAWDLACPLTVVSLLGGGILTTFFQYLERRSKK